MTIILVFALHEWIGRVWRAVDQKSIYSITTRGKNWGPLINRQKHKRSSSHTLRPSSSSSSSPPPLQTAKCEKPLTALSIVPGTFHTLNNGPLSGRRTTSSSSTQMGKYTTIFECRTMLTMDQGFSFPPPSCPLCTSTQAGPSAHVIIKMLEKKGSESRMRNGQSWKTFINSEWKNLKSCTNDDGVTSGIYKGQLRKSGRSRSPDSFMTFQREFRKIKMIGCVSDLGKCDEKRDITKQLIFVSPPPKKNS